MDKTFKKVCSSLLNNVNEKKLNESNDSTSQIQSNLGKLGFTKLNAFYGKLLECKNCNSKEFKLKQSIKDLILITCCKCNEVLTDFFNFYLIEKEKQIELYKQIKKIVFSSLNDDFSMMIYYQLRVILNGKGFDVDG